MRNSYWGLVLSAAIGAVGCGAEPAVSSNEPEAQTTQAVETLYDTSVAAVTRVNIAGVRYLWVFVCDFQGRLLRTTARDVRDTLPSWSTWQHIDTGCLGSPSAISDIFLPGAASTSAVSVFVTWNDGHLWQLKYDRADLPSKWVNVSWSAGWSQGGAALPPMVVYGKAGLGEVSVAARNTRNEVFTFDRYDGAWHYSSVVDSAGNVLKSANRLAARWEDYLLMQGVTYLSGRGVSASDDRTGWVARRAVGSRGPLTVPPPGVAFQPFNGTPVLGLDDQTHGSVFYWCSEWPCNQQNGVPHPTGTLKSHGYPNGNPIVPFQNCDVSAGPAPHARDNFGWIRSASGTLLRYSAQNPQHVCVREGSVRFVESAITAASGSGAYYAGLGGELMHWDMNMNKEQAMGVKVLF